MTVAGTRAAQRLFVDDRDLSLTPVEFCDAIVDFLRDNPDFAQGPFIYSVGVTKRGPSQSPTDPSYFDHTMLYAAGEPERERMIRVLVSPGAIIDISMCRAGHEAEHKYAKITGATQ